MTLTENEIKAIEKEAAEYYPIPDNPYGNEDGIAEWKRQARITAITSERIKAKKLLMDIFKIASCQPEYPIERMSNIDLADFLNSCLNKITIIILKELNHDGNNKPSAPGKKG